MTTQIGQLAKTILALGLVSLALTACGTKSRGSQAQKNMEKPVLNPAQRSVADSGIETKWAEQGLSWKLPPGWKKERVDRDSFNYSGPNNSFMSVNVDTQNSIAPLEKTLAYLEDDALQKQKSGMYQNVRRIEIDGVPGIEFTEAPMKDGQSPRIRQWRGYRRDYLDAKQEVIVMLQTNSANFDKRIDEFTAIIYSMKAAK